MATIMETLDKKLGNDHKSMTIMEALGGKVGSTIADVVAESDVFVEPEVTETPG